MCICTCALFRTVSERESYFTVHCTDEQHAMSSHELQSALMLTVKFSKMYYEPGQLSRYSDYLLAGRPSGRSSSPGRVKNFHFSMSSRPSVGSTQPPIQWVNGRGVKLTHSPPTSAEVKKMWIYTTTPPYVFMV
jgi:hypothetical protein